MLAVERPANLLLVGERRGRRISTTAGLTVTTSDGRFWMGAEWPVGRGDFNRMKVSLDQNGGAPIRQSNQEAQAQ